ncbi:putative NBD/HSP70 family sugar kinase [Trichococcus patagoniensis]|uniref:Putative NBD/HSP70 family sugar kinase n=1 Tax=Trichococcus patagoniensis TaxID=382641 RepID=A0A2T5IF04_9LACT|nr:ROK family protein [Trichococcus patagoniensis]PTQ82414.1 putative NBD/HSP70 family sugar kinase [Trichococcus patagoniensis]
MVSNYLCIDVGGTFIKYAYADHFGKISYKNKETTPIDLEGFLDVIRSIVIKNAENIDGIAICCPGKVDRKKGTIFHGGSLQYLDELPLKDILEDEFHLPVGVINDGKAAALSELWLGNLKGCDNGVAIVLGTAIGGGIIANGQLLEGEHFQAGEFSFIVHRAKERAAKSLTGDRLSAVAFVENGSQKIGLVKADGQLVFDAINQGNQEMVQHLEDYCYELALTILNIQAVLDFSKVVIGGGISAQPRLIQEIDVQLQKIRSDLPALEATMCKPIVLPCKFYNDANILGALYNLLSMPETADRH